MKKRVDFKLYRKGFGIDLPFRLSNTVAFLNYKILEITE